ncbi:hypothetical protein AALP_AA8G207000 [Arabis alpina]|uniref:DNA topoisomerase (ATP-hydrolyzing) n=1 Tax=Arabis alpina TaxID=50452 RepID=A0A087G8C3_ARAAL|nr:hypothetical protein AALP_AA8G207000 [Arabis alpina]
MAFNLPLQSSNNVNVPKANTKAPASKAEKTTEEMHHKKSQQILLRPDTYIGSIEKHTQTLWVYEKEEMVHRPVTYVPGLYKIFDEILVNAADNKQRYSSMDSLKVVIDVEQNLISVYGKRQKKYKHVDPLLLLHVLKDPPAEKAKHEESENSSKETSKAIAVDNDDDEDEVEVVPPVKNGRKPAASKAGKPPRKGGAGESKKQEEVVKIVLPEEKVRKMRSSPFNKKSGSVMAENKEKDSSSGEIVEEK